MHASYVRTEYDAVVVGGGPNGLAAAIRLQQAGLQTLLLEAKGRIGGGAYTDALTLPGFRHDVGSAIHPLGVGSPFFQTLPLANYGLEWIYPPTPVAHPFDDGTAAALEHSLEETVAHFPEDADRYRDLMTPLVEGWDALVPDLLGPLRWPADPLLLAQFGLKAVQSARWLSRTFRGERARALFAGLAAHAKLPLEAPVSAAFGLVLGAAGHRLGWPLPKGGAERIAEALGSHFRHLGGTVRVNARVAALGDLPRHRVALFDLTPWQLLAIRGLTFPRWYRRQLENYRYGSGIFKVDWALSEPVPFRAAAARRAGTLHLGGLFDEVAHAERAVHRGKHPARPFVLFAQPSLFDPSRAPAGQHAAWAYCHVPNGSDVDLTDAVEAQVERFAPGFRDCILARHVMKTADVQRYNANYVGGDINGGEQNVWQLFTRPTLSLSPYATAHPGVYICSSATPPGGGVHGMCGYHAAERALRDLNVRTAASY